MKSRPYSRSGAGTLEKCAARRCVEGRFRFLFAFLTSVENVHRTCQTCGGPGPPTGKRSPYEGVPAEGSCRPDRRRVNSGKQPFLPISRTSPLISLSFATGYCRLLFLQHLGKRFDWRKSLCIEEFRKSLYINGGFLFIIPGKRWPGDQSRGGAGPERGVGDEVF